MSLSVALGESCFIRAATAARLGAACEVPKKLGWPSRSNSLDVGGPVGPLAVVGGLTVEMSPPGSKKLVSAPSGPEKSGFRCTSTLGSRVPSALKTLYAGPNELNP